MGGPGDGINRPPEGPGGAAEPPLLENTLVPELKVGQEGVVCHSSAYNIIRALGQKLPGGAVFPTLPKKYFGPQVMSRERDHLHYPPLVHLGQFENKCREHTSF